jgi:hypothetical protein
MITIDLRTPLSVSVPDAAGEDHAYDLVEGLNDVPPEVAEHWYVKKFQRPLRRVPRTVVPSAAQPMALPPAAISTMAEALKPATEPVVVAAADPVLPTTGSGVKPPPKN